MKQKAPAKRPAPFARRLFIMAKLPVMGRVKTRLARDVGFVAATYFYRHVTAAVVGRLRCDPRWQTILAVDPDTACRSNVWPAGLARMGQGRGGLGERMQRLFEVPLPGPVIVVGTDIPLISRDEIARAFRRLAANDAVFGPAEDGGYWLVGLRRSPRVLKPFGRVRWSGPHALADSEANLAGRPIARAGTLQDVDGRADLDQLGALAGRRVLPVTRVRASRSARAAPASR